MGREIIRVPTGFQHPTDEAGNHVIGGHHELLYKTDPTLLTAYQVYENVSEGTPVSPDFPTLEALNAWLTKQGLSPEQAQAFVEDGHAPSFVVRC